MLTYFLPQGLGVNANTYIKMLDTVVNYQIVGVGPGESCMFQQDSGPPRTTYVAQGWLAENFHNYVNPKHLHFPHTITVFSNAACTQYILLSSL